MAHLRPVPRWLLPTFLALSLVAHFAFWAVARSDLRTPSIDLELQLPAEVEFGLSEGVAGVDLGAQALAEQQAAEAEAAAEAAAEEEAEAEAEAKAEAEARAEAERARRAAARAKREAERARREAEAQQRAQQVGSELPPGAQIAVRIDMQRIRESPIAQDVRGLLDAIPDWHALLDGSGIDPLESLDRLLIATPNLQRSRIVVAGRYRGDRSVVDRAVQQLATNKGVTAEWQQRGSVPVAPWANVDATERVIALIGPQHFSISREEDLPRLLAVAVAREQQRKRQDEPETSLPAEELLSMPERAGLSLEVEGVRQFVRRGNGIPIKLRIHALETDEGTVKLRGRWVYEDAAAATAAAEYWNGVRTRFATNTLVAILGLASPLREGTIESEGDELHLQAELGVRQTRMILGYLRELVAPPPALPPAGGSASKPPTTDEAP